MPKRKPPGRAVSSRDRATDFRPTRERILIVCEGEKTEPNYFNALIRYHRLNTVFVDQGRQLEVTVDGVGRVTRSLVEDAEQRQGRGVDGYHEIWCVFDKDSFPDDDFDNAVAKTRGHEFLRAAWSNEAFELWYVLHFEYLNTAPTRGRGVVRNYYIERLHTLLRSLGRDRYHKNDESLYELLGASRRDQAVRNARRLLNEYPDGTACHACKPATTVHELVERLLSYAPETPVPTQGELTDDVADEGRTVRLSQRPG
jgi:hypothetical protein